MKRSEGRAASASSGFIIKRVPPFRERLCISWWAHQDSNLGPTGYEPVALPTELWARVKHDAFVVHIIQPAAGAMKNRHTLPVFSFGVFTVKPLIRYRCNP